MRDVKITQARAAIRLAASELADGDTARVECPFCGGGRNHDESFYVTHSEGAALYVCHRASCGKRGRLSLGGALQVIRDRHRVDVPRSAWTGSLTRTLPARWQRKFDDAVLARDGSINRFHQMPSHYGLFGNADKPDEIVWLLRDMDGRRIGVQTRAERNGRKYVLSHKETDKSLYAYFAGSRSGSEPLWIVEDCLSAAAICAWGRKAVALTGTYLHDDVRDDITTGITSGFVVALDPGAERAAALVKQRLSCYTTRPVHVLYLNKDIKDMNYQEQSATILARGRL